VAVIKIAVILLQKKARKNSKAVWIITIGNSHYRLIFYLGKKEYIPGKGILK
jgi:hypothetical protein